MSRCEGCRLLTVRPLIRISPEVMLSRPAMVLSRVDLPQPDGPTSTRNPPSSTARVMPFSASTVPKRFCRLSISRNAMVLLQSALHGTGHQAAHEIAAGGDG